MRHLQLSDRFSLWQAEAADVFFFFPPAPISSTPSLPSILTIRPPSLLCLTEPVHPRCCEQVLFPCQGSPQWRRHEEWSWRWELLGKSGRLPEPADANIATRHQECLKIRTSPKGGGKGNKITKASAEVDVRTQRKYTKEGGSFTLNYRGEDGGRGKEERIWGQNKVNWLNRTNHIHSNSSLPSFIKTPWWVAPSWTFPLSHQVLTLSVPDKHSREEIRKKLEN